MKFSDDQTPARYEIVVRAPDQNGSGRRHWPGTPRPSLHTWLEKRTSIHWVGLTLLAMLGVIALFGFMVICAAGISKLLH